MRVCMITPRYPPDRCGVGDYTALLASYLVARGIAVTVITSRAGAMHADDSITTAATGVRVLRVVEGWSWRSLPRLGAIVAAGRYDLAHVQYQNEMYGRSASVTALPLALRALRPRLPTVVTVHDYGTPWPRRLRMRALAGPYGKAWFAAMLLASARIILTNEQDWWRFLRQRPRYPIPASRYAMIPVGSNLPTPPTPPMPPTAEHQAPDKEPRIGYFGFVNAAKGVDMLLDGFALAHRRRPHLRLTMVCRLDAAEPYHQMVRAKITDLALDDAVSVTGELDDGTAADILASCDVVALPFREGISTRRTTLIAALSLGRPVVSTRATVPPPGLRNGYDLILVPPLDAVALADALVALADDPVRRAELGENARRAAAAFAWPAIAARTEELYRTVG